jgi:hypothetical protein
MLCWKENMCRPLAYSERTYIRFVHCADSEEKKMQRRFLVKHVPESRKLKQKFLKVPPG